MILVLGFVIRLTAAITHSYSNDELSAIYRLRFDNFSDLIEQGVKMGDMHPAGVQLFMKFWASLGPLDEWWMRLPFVIFGTIAIYFTFLIGKRWLNRNTGLIAAIFLSLLYFPVLNTEFARPYSLGLMLSTIAAYYYIRILRAENKGWKDTIILGITIAGMMYTHYFAFLFAGWMLLSGLIILKKGQFKHILVAGLIAGILFAPHIPVTIYHLNVGGLQWLGPPEADWLFQFLYFSFNASPWIIGGLGIIGLLTLIFSTAFKEEDEPKVYWVFLAWFIGIYLVGHALSLVSTPVLKFPVMLFAFPYLLLLLAGCLARFKYQKVLLTILPIGLGLSLVYEKDIYGNQHYELLKEPAHKITDWQSKYGKDNIRVIYNLNDPFYMNFYATQWGDSIVFDRHVIEYGDASAIREELKGAREDFCVVGYSGRLTLHQVFETCKEFYPYIVDYEKYNNAAVFLLSNNKQYEQYLHPTENIANFFPINENKQWESDSSAIELLLDTNGLVVDAFYTLEEARVYGPTLKIKKSELPDITVHYFMISVHAIITAEGQLTATVAADRNGKPLEHRGEVFWMGQDLEQMLQEKGQAYFAFRIPDFVEDDDLLKFSLWSRNPSSKVLIRGVSVDAFENVWND